MITKYSPDWPNWDMEESTSGYVKDDDVAFVLKGILEEKDNDAMRKKIQALIDEMESY